MAADVPTQCSCVCVRRWSGAAKASRNRLGRAEPAPAMISRGVPVRRGPKDDGGSGLWSTLKRWGG